MGAFSIPSLPTLPSLPSVKSFINTSPPLVYHTTSGQTTTPRRNNREKEEQDTPTRRTGNTNSALFPASPSVHDVSLEWERVDRNRRGSITSLRSFKDEQSDARPILPRSGSSTSLHRGRPLSMVDPSSHNPLKPTHRRSQSVIPKRPTPPAPFSGPMGRLHEISRNPMASSSAISLPTLCESGSSGSSMGERGPSIPPSPVSLPRSRRSSQARSITPLDLEEGDETDTSSISSHVPISTRPRGHSSTLSSIPPPNAMMPPPSVRPLPSPRSWSVQDVRPNARSQGGLSRRSSLSVTSSTSLSDVEVLATWSFPSAPSKEAETVPETRIDQPSEKLRDRLKRLSTLDTSGLTPPQPKKDRDITTPKGRLVRSSTTSNVSRHRHSHSSPVNLLPIPPVSVSGPTHSGSVQPLLPPMKAVRRPTTSRLRHPNPLSMPLDIDRGGHDKGNSWLSSSPGSLVSDGKSASGSDGEVSSPSGSVASLPPVSLDGEKKSYGLGFKGWMRNNCQGNFDTIATTEVETVQELSVKMKGSLYVSMEEQDEEEDDERYLSLDDI